MRCIGKMQTVKQHSHLVKLRQSAGQIGEDNPALVFVIPDPDETEQ